MVEERTVPKLRFKGFADEWEIIKLKDVLKKIKDGTHSSFKNTKTGPFLLSAKNIRNDQLILSNNERHISKEDLNRINKPFEPTIGDVLLTIVGTIGNTYLVNKNLNNIAFQRSVAFLRPDKKIILSSYLEDLLNTGHVKLQIKQRETLSAQPGIYLNDLSKIKINISRSSEEQAKIAVIFEKINEALSLQQQKLAQLQKLKKGFLQNLFPKDGALVPKTRFQGFIDNWKQFKLKEVLKKLKDGTHSSFQSTKSGPFLLSAKNIKNDQLILTLSERHISKEDLNRINKTFRPIIGDILLTIVGTIGNTYLVNKPLNKIAFQRSVAFLRPNNKKVLPLYLKDLLNTEQVKIKIKRRETLSAQAGLYLNDLSQIKLIVSGNLKEQKKIALILDKIDKIIFLQKKKIYRFKQIKKFLLENMFI